MNTPPPGSGPAPAAAHPSPPTPKGRASAPVASATSTSAAAAASTGRASPVLLLLPTARSGGPCSSPLLPPLPGWVQAAAGELRRRG